MRKAVFPGTFDPFTMGHLSVIKQASKLFDEVTILFAINSNKTRMIEQEKMMKAVRKAIKRYGLKNVKVDSCGGLVVSYCERNQIDYIVRGLRNQSDFAYEEEIATTNALINSDIETIYFHTKETGISSSLVRTLFNAQRDISYYVPSEVHTLMKSYD